MKSVTYLLERWSAGDRAAAEQVMPLVYDHLRRIAARHLGRGRGAPPVSAPRGATAPRPGGGGGGDQPRRAPAIVQGAYLRLRGRGPLPGASREPFSPAPARLIRQILVDHARHRHRLKRGG